MNIKHWRILVMIGWILFFTHVMVWSFVLMFTSNSIYTGDNHSLGPIFSYLTDHETFVKVNIPIGAVLLTALIAVFSASLWYRHARWSRAEFAVASAMIVTTIGAYIAYMCLWYVVFYNDSLARANRTHPLLGNKIYKIEGIGGDQFVASFDSIRNSKWEYTHYYTKQRIERTIDEANAEWTGNHYSSNFYLPKGDKEAIIDIYNYTDSNKLEIAVFGRSIGLTPKDLKEFESITLDKICTYDRCELRRHKESYYSYMSLSNSENILFALTFGLSFIASLIVLLMLKKRRDRNLPPPFNPPILAEN